MVQRYICGVVHSGRQVLDGAFAKFIHSEDVVVDVGDAVDVVLKDVDAEGVMELCVENRGDILWKLHRHDTCKNTHCCYCII